MAQTNLDQYPRDLAVRILTRVLSDRLTLDQAFQKTLADQKPGEQEFPARAWLLEVCSGTLRWKGRLEIAIDSIATKKKPSGWLRKILLIAAYQLIVQERTSPGAVVSETVNEVRRKEGEAPAKFSNALLRKVAEHALSWRTQGLKAKPGIEELALWASLPPWVARDIIAAHGRPWFEAFAEATLERPRIWIRARRSDWKPAPDLQAEPGPIPASFRLGEGGAITEMGGFREGEFIVQDISSQLLVEEIAERVKGAGKGIPKALDLCAAPGGKAVGLAWKGFKVSACDRDETRLALLKNTLERVGADVSVCPRNAVKDLPPQDLVWVDAPCTGTGIIRRHPDVRWLRQEKELPQLLLLQAELIREGWEKVGPGGFFAYSVCSVLKDEGPKQIDRAGLEGIRMREWFLAPQEGPHGDGFWAVLIQKS